MTSQPRPWLVAGYALATLLGSYRVLEAISEHKPLTDALWWLGGLWVFGALLVGELLRR